MSPITMADHSRITARIESLTVELRILILCESADIHTLKSLVLSCSPFYQAYHSARKEILLIHARRVFSNDDIPLQLPYLAAIKASRVEKDVSDYLRTIKQFLDEASEVDETSTTNITADDCIQLLNLHRDATLITEDLFTVSLPRRQRSEEDPQPEKEQPPSQTERQRIAKAIFRWELWSNLFTERHLTHPLPSSPPPKQTVDTVSHYPDPQAQAAAKTQVTLFLARYPLWEQEQLGCLCDYAMRRYNALFDALANLSGQSRNNNGNQAENQLSIFETTNHTASVAARDNLRDGIISRGGPALLARILRSETPDNNNNNDLNLKHQAHLLLDHIPTGPKGPNLPDLLLRSYAPQAASPTRRDSARGLLFTEDPPTPPYGWLWARENITAPGPFPWFSHEYLSPWGYVFWDYSRFQAWGMLIGGKYAYFDEDPGVDDSGEYGVCERVDGRPVDEERVVRQGGGMFREFEWIPLEGGG